MILIIAGPSGSGKTTAGTLLAGQATLSLRLAGRHGHFFPPDLLHSQLADQEVPDGEVNVLVVTPQGLPADTVTEIIARVWPSGAPQ